MNGFKNEILTIGHSTQSYENFLRKLRTHNVTALADVRSAPFSKYFPQYNRDALKEELRLDGISYVFLGDELGGRPKGKEFFCDGVADYEKMAKSPSFAKGLDRVMLGAQKYRIALMCSEHDPLDCHRCLLVGRSLHAKGVSVLHILGDGRTETHPDIEARLMELAGSSDYDFFETSRQRLEKAYRERALKVAYADPSGRTDIRADMV